MKYLLTFFLLFAFAQLKAQNGDLEVKVVSKQYRTVVGHLKKVSPEGIGVEDYKGNYLIFRAADIVRVKVRKRGITIVEGLGGGALIGLGIGGGLLSLDESGNNTNGLIALTAILIGSGAAGGTITGIIAQLINNKLTLRVNGSDEKFRAGYKKLEKYVDATQTEYVNYSSSLN